MMPNKPIHRKKSHTWKRFIFKLTIFIGIVLLVYDFCPPISSSKGWNEGACKEIQSITSCPWCGSCEEEFATGNAIEHGMKTLADGSTFTGQLLNGEPHGHGILVYPYGSRYEGGFLNAKPHGQGTMIYPNGNKYVGQFEDGKPNGEGTLTCFGSTYVGEFLDGKPNGKGTKTFTNGGMYIGQWKEGKKHGFGIEKHLTENARSGYWRHGTYIGIKNPQIKL